MKKNFITGIMGLLLLSIVIGSCKKDEDEVELPSIVFNTATGYIAASTTAGYGDTLLFGLNFEWNGTDKLVKVKVSMNGLVQLDSTINQNTFQLDYTAIKGLENSEAWRFETTDIAGNTKEASLTITAAFGAINTYASILIGAQDNTLTPSFLSFSNSTYTLYFQAAAFNNQADIDMFCFYEDTPSHQNFMTLAAPGSNITGIFTGSTAPENYTVKNVTYFVKTNLTVAEFDAVANDAMILASYDPNNKFKKAKALAAGEVYCFLLQNGKKGLYKVKNVSGTTDGTLELAVKIQQ